MSTREYPDRPVVGVGGVVFIDKRVVLIRRRNPPLAGQWSLPGGAVEVGETLQEGLRRELREEIGIDTRVGPLLTLLDRIIRDPDGRVRHHYVLADFLCHPVGGALRSGSDAAAVVLADPGGLARFALSDQVRAVIARALDARLSLPSQSSSDG